MEIKRIDKISSHERKLSIFAFSCEYHMHTRKNFGALGRGNIEDT
jgi:hypothetical protein